MRHPWMLSAAWLAACGGEPVEGPACADPPRGPAMRRFVDATPGSGLDFVYAATSFKGGGLAVGDLDGDGLPDLVAARREGGLALYRNRGGLRFEARGDSGLDPAARASAIGAADLDNDGDRDLVLAGRDGATIFANHGDGTFAEAARFADAGSTEHVLPVDLDGDGLLELHLGNYELRGGAATQNRLLRNGGGLAFTDAGVAGPATASLTWTATAFDVDADGDQDLYVANDTLLADFGDGLPPRTPFHPVDYVLRNDGPGADGVPRFTDVAAEVGLASPRSSMGGVLGDVDGDGALELYVPDFGANKLFARAAGGFVDRAAALGVAGTRRASSPCAADPRTESCLVLSWSAAFADFDHDGHDELLVVNGATFPGDLPPVLAFGRAPALPFREVAPELPCMDARGLVATDLDGDGDQDVVVAHKDGPLAIYENTGAPPAETWLAVTLRGRTSNRDGIGAVVILRQASGRTQTRIIGAGGVVHTATPLEAHFGLGTDRAEAIEVQWPSGRRTALARPPAGTVVVIDEGP